MKLALTAALKPGSSAERVYPPLALGYLAAAVQHALPHVEVRILADEQAIVDFAPHVVGISSVTENFSHALSLAGRLGRATSARVVAGGLHATCLPASLGEDFHAAVIGEGEETLVEMLRHPDSWDEIRGVALPREGKWTMREERPLVDPLDRIAPPDRRQLLQAWPAPAEAHLVTSRGCVYQCPFCSSTRQWGRYRQFSAARVVQEIEAVLQDQAPLSVRFFDDLFVADRARLREIHDRMRRAGLHERATYSGYVRASDFDEEVCRLLRDMNFRVVNFGAESGSDRILQRLKGRGARVEHNQRLLDLCHHHGLLPSASFIIGVPGETPDDLAATVAFIEKSEDRLFDVQIFPLVPYPGTAYWRLAVRRGLLSSRESDWSRLGILLSDLDPERYPYLNAPGLPLESFLSWVEGFRALNLRIKPYPHRLRRMPPQRGPVAR